MQGLRQFENEEDCKIAIKACNIALKQLKICIAAIFELSAISQGSYFEIATLLQQYQRPILCLSHKEFGRKFGKMINGHPSRLLRTIRYNDSNLEDIVTKFLTVEINNYKMVSFNFRLPSYLQSRIIELTNEGGYKSTSDFLRWLIQNYIDNYIR